MVSLVAVRPRPSSCQGLTVKTARPCRNTRGLNADGFCKYHVPGALQCRGLAKSTGERCRIKWDLDGDQFCPFHTGQARRPKFPQDDAVDDDDAGDHVESKAKKPLALPTKPELKATKAAKAKAKATGGVVVKTHAAPRCRGIAKSTGQRCRIDWELDGNELCKYHGRQTPAFSMSDRHAAVAASPVKVAPPRVAATQCLGTAASTGQRCRIAWNLDALGYCKYHPRQAHRARL